MGLNKNQNSGNFNGEVGDMSNYATKSDLETKVTKETNKSLVDNTLIDKLEDLENYDDSLVREEIDSINSQLAHNAKYKKIKMFNTYEDMKSDASLKIGDICKTLGYYIVNDGGGAEYYINNSTSSIINKEINNGLKAQLIIDNTKGIVLDTVGIRPGSVDYIEKNSEIFNELARFASKKYQLYLNPLRYYISNLDMSDVSDFELALIGTNQNVSQNGVKSTIATNGGNFITTQKTGFFVKASDMVFTSGVTDKIPRGICFGSLQANSQEVNFDFNNVWFSLFDKAFYSPSWSCASFGKCVSFTNCHTGMYVGMASHTLEIDKLNLNYNVCGIHLGRGGNYSELRNVHVATGYYMADADEFDEIVAIRSGGGSIIRGLYYEPYISDNTEKQILIDYTGYGWGVKGLYVYNTQIGYPGASNTGIFLRGKTNKGDHQYKWFYPDGCVHFVDCTYNINTLPNLFKIYQNSTGELTNSWFGYSINNRPIIANGIGIGRNLTYYINTTCDNLTFAKTLQNTYRLSNEFQDIDMGNGFKNTYILDKRMYQLHVYSKTTSGTIRIKGVICLNNITSQEGVLRIMSTSSGNTQAYGACFKIVDLNTVKSEYTDSRIVIPFNFELNNETFDIWNADACWFECSKEITEENKSKIHLKFTVEYDQDYDNHIS